MLSYKNFSQNFELVESPWVGLKILLSYNKMDFEFTKNAIKMTNSTVQYN